ncbi:hypothetical protein EMIHUDRAFT_62877 [Emiliania huxleyi CCMP1516]|uniref:2-dehydro-3-deoxy-phosphogluconate aldolase n=2 Tax=Emiliania huxleyi TaxID=2903 RepID=A0A0D3KQY2_EMIH1|nr:hypothetical protein EMIHUDRAFT_62877 [Emiliania huxleyi CCMP1516]EOD38167.1 hypothetical protein EMIHUDRAFT_62877 [Emiliania huxleyi CCMP1516]|eukprot:XP_005790596.1 hypothetical protein EMIHUDRAFT_62877 [Emiliania huxleyi CCMP1516]
MARFGDLSDVSGGALRAAEARWAGVTAQLNASGAGGGGVVAGGGGEGASGAAPPQRFAPFHAAAASVFERFGRTRLVPVVSLASPEAAEPVARALLRGGVDVMELVLRTPSAMQALRLIASKVPEMAVGAGTVLSAEQAEQAVAAGASFLVSPGTAAISTHLTTSHHTSSTNPRVVEWATQRGVPIVPGCATASEIEAALELGLTHLKFFPAEARSAAAEIGGAAALKALGGPYKDVRFMPTGGVTQANLPSYLSLPGVFAAGGTWLVPAEAVAKRDWAAVEALTRAAVQAAAEAS